MDHASLLDDVLTCYDIDHVWDVGVINDAVFYRDFWKAVAAEPQVEIRTVAPPPQGRVLSIAGERVSVPQELGWSTFEEGHEEALGDGARFTVLHADASDHSDFNENSLVLRMELGGTSMLLTGDAESGPREVPNSPAGDIEKHLLERYAAEIDVDILQIGHHGSMTSSRLEFLRAASPGYALISAGPRKYGSVVLPDEEVVEALEAVGAEVLRTDGNDAGGCPAPNRLGTDGERAGGCDSYLLRLIER